MHEVEGIKKWLIIMTFIPLSYFIVVCR